MLKPRYVFSLIICCSTVLAVLQVTPQSGAQRRRRGGVPSSTQPKPSPAPRATPAPTPIPKCKERQPLNSLVKSEMTNEQKHNAWIGKKVVLLSTQTDEAFHAEGKPRQVLPKAQYIGKTGTVVGIIKDKEGYMKDWSKLTIELDGSRERIVADDPDYVGFLEEMEIATKYVRRTFYARGEIDLLKNWKPGMTSEEARGQRISVKNTQPLTAVAVNWGERTYARVKPFIFTFKTADGQEGVLDEGGIFDERFHENKGVFTLSAYLSPGSFYADNPRTLCAGWPAQVWELIEREEVAIGMTVDMVALACKRVFRQVVQLSLTNPEQSGTIYSACGRKVLIRNDTVANVEW